MKEITGNLWDYYGKPEYQVCITTNGVVKGNGEAVMGRGCAKEAMTRFPDLPARLGAHLEAFGNVTYVYGMPPKWLRTFPVKHHWREAADLGLIQQSARHLAGIARENPAITFILPRPGCGNGRRSWLEVKPLLESLPDNVHVISF